MPLWEQHPTTNADNSGYTVTVGAGTGSNPNPGGYQTTGGHTGGDWFDRAPPPEPLPVLPVYNDNGPLPWVRPSPPPPLPPRDTVEPAPPARRRAIRLDLK